MQAGQHAVGIWFSVAILYSEEIESCGFAMVLLKHRGTLTANKRKTEREANHQMLARRRSTHLAAKISYRVLDEEVASIFESFASCNFTCPGVATLAPKAIESPIRKHTTRSCQKLDGSLFCVKLIDVPQKNP